MNYQYAKKIEKEDGLEDCVGDSHCNLVFAKGGAKGYLEAHAKAQKLAEALERALVLCPKIGNKEWFEDILDQWHKENKEGE